MGILFPEVFGVGDVPIGVLVRSFPFREARGDSTRVIGESEKLNSAGAPGIDRLSDPEGV